MKIRTVVLGLALALAAFAAAAQTRPGVGYDPHGHGLTVSRYQLDSLNSPFLSYPADFSAHPDEVGAHPNAYYLDFSDPAVRAAIELRWGPGTTSDRFKRWAGPGNEVKFLLHDALVWAFKTHPEALGGDVSNRNGEPTEVEITDLQAFDDHGLWISYFQAVLPGYSADRRVTVCDAKLPPGDSETTEPFWGLPYFVHNTFQTPPPFSPQLPLSMSCGG